VLDALPEEEESRLKGKGRELLEKSDLFIHLLLEESASEVFRPDSCPEKGYAGTADVLDVVDCRLGAVEGPGCFDEKESIGSRAAEDDKRR
jgi:hypothetical protein